MTDSLQPTKLLVRFLVNEGMVSRWKVLSDFNSNFILKVNGRAMLTQATRIVNQLDEIYRDYSVSPTFQHFQQNFNVFISKKTRQKILKLLPIPLKRHLHQVNLKVRNVYHQMI